MTNRLIGGSTRPPQTSERVTMKVTSEARERLRTLLFEPEMRAVGYSEFLMRACEEAEGAIIEHRREEEDHG